MSLGFQRLTRDDVPRIDHLTMAPGQDAFTADPALRLASLAADQHAWAILWAGDAVGFLVIDQGFAATHDFARPGEPGLRSVLIDAARQGEGIGKAAMAGLRGLMAATYPEAESLVLTVNERNPAARAVYLNAGFADTGALWLGGRSGPQHILRLELRTGV
ncbi:MAG: GNAT family N-acetyltransferase [Rhodobacteraceae bacterium]|nr:GNAT family N-acetyltransferase [Paracoccaceae bacterium]